MITTVLAQAAVPTWRAMSWRPLAAAAVSLFLFLALLRGFGQPADTVLGLAAATLASLEVGSLHDPAGTLLATVPVSAMRRRALRLTLVGAPVLSLWWTLTLISGSSSAPHGPGQLLALAAAGLAVAVSVPSQRGVLIGGSVPMGWYILDQLAPLAGAADDVAGWWRTEPWSVVAAALVVMVAGRQR